MDEYADTSPSKDRIEDRRKLDSCQEEISRLHHQLQQQTLSLQTLDPETHQQIQTASYESCAPSILAAKSICASIQEVDLESDGERDATHEARTSSDNESLRTMIPISDFKVDTDLEDKPLTDLDRLLFLQRPYRAARRRSSLASFDSAASDEKKVAWSWISSVSAAEVSNLSLFELPIQKADLFRPHVWEAGQTATPDASLVIATQSYTTRSQHHLDHTSRSLHNAVGRADKFLVKALPNRFKSRRSIQLYILNQNCRAAQSNIKDESTIEDAKDILKGALDGYMHLHDPNGVIDSVQKLEAIYRRQEKLGDVEEIYARVLDFCKDALGCEHKATLELAHDLSCIYGEQGKMDEAAHLSERILEWDQSNAPNNKRIKAHAAYNLGLIYSAEDKFDRAEKILTDALNVFQNTGKVRGQDREEFILETGTMHLLANISRKQGKDQDFENMRLRASDKYRKSGLYKAETNVHGDPGLANDAWKHFGTEEASSMYAGITRLRRTSVASVLSHRPISPTHALYTTQQRRTQTGNRASAPHSPSTAKPSKPADQSLNPTGTGWHCEPDMPDKPGGTDEV